LTIQGIEKTKGWSIEIRAAAAPYIFEADTEAPELRTPQHSAINNSTHGPAN
jgi:hypothetical protein